MSILPTNVSPNIGEDSGGPIEYERKDSLIVPGRDLRFSINEPTIWPYYVKGRLVAINDKERLLGFGH